MKNVHAISSPTLLKDLGMRYATETSKGRKRYGLYRCSCGEEFEATSGSIKTGNTKSCGCHKHRGHLRTGHRLYTVWNGMKNRCCNPNSKDYMNYGSRGITLCDSWLSIENFIKDMDNSYRDGLSIDRIDNNKGYSKENCRWTTLEVQQQNTRRLSSRNTSGYRGVHYDTNARKYRARIGVNKTYIHLGFFSSAIEAAVVYDEYVVNNNLNHTINNVTHKEGV